MCLRVQKVDSCLFELEMGVLPMACSILILESDHEFQFLYHWVVNIFNVLIWSVLSF